MSRPILRVNRRRGFVQVERSTTRDEEISYRALGLLVHILGRPDDWQVRAETLAGNKKRNKRTMREGRDSVRKTLHELARRGYYRLERRRYLDGTTAMGTAVSEYPVEQWARDYQTFGQELAVSVVEQPDGTFMVRYPDGTLGPDGFHYDLDEKGSPTPDEEPPAEAEEEPEATATDEHDRRLPPAARAARARKAAAQAAEPETAPAPEAKKTRSRRTPPAAQAARVKKDEPKKVEDQEAADVARQADKIAKWWWEGAQTHIGAYVGKTNGFLVVRGMIQRALEAGYTEKQVKNALWRVRRHVPSAQQWQDALVFVTKGVTPTRSTRGPAYDDEATWGPIEQRRTPTPPTDDSPPQFGVVPA